jgi:glycosyltransferase involved in cell wall biosynthesis
LHARLLVVGGESEEPDPAVTPEIGRLMSVAEQERVLGAVTFVGRRGREVLRDYYSAADVFVTTPWYEPFGITPVEAMACGTPVVGSNVGGIKTTVRDGETGFLVPPNDADALADRLAILLRNPALLSGFSRHAVGRANDRYTWDRVTRRLDRIYQRVLSRPRVVPARLAAAAGPPPRSVIPMFTEATDAPRARNSLGRGRSHSG